MSNKLQQIYLTEKNPELSQGNFDTLVFFAATLLLKSSPGRMFGCVCPKQDNIELAKKESIIIPKQQEKK